MLNCEHTNAHWQVDLASPATGRIDSFYLQHGTENSSRLSAFIHRSRQLDPP
jgi:hypothetical protein